MYLETLAIARNEDWPWQPPQAPVCLFAGDHLIALAVDCRRQQRWQAAPMTDEDAAIFIRAGLACDRTEYGEIRHFPNDRISLAYLINLNA